MGGACGKTQLHSSRPDVHWSELRSPPPMLRVPPLADGWPVGPHAPAPGLLEARTSLHGREGVLGALMEERTLWLLVAPMCTIIITAMMTVSNTLATLDQDRQVLFISRVLNDPVPEPWVAFAFRWFLWHFSIWRASAFKCRVLPVQYHWLVLASWLSIYVATWAGYCQTEIPHDLNRIKCGIHILAAAAIFITLWLETVTLWWPSEMLNAAYGAIVVVCIGCYAFANFVFKGRSPLETGIPYIYNQPEVVIEWLVVIVHFPIVWYRYPVVSDAIADGSWRPWFPWMPRSSQGGGLKLRQLPRF
mmetsp:Transcript_3123/g.6587  ORF Transcript_3123/g.6587 Transcript_3123/m.6587 type:complete len:304 (+) Transcript_3123:94-1005(+)